MADRFARVSGRNTSSRPVQKKNRPRFLCPLDRAIGRNVIGTRTRWDWALLYPVLVPTRVGLAAITTRGLVFAGDRRTRWDFATVKHEEWPDQHSAVFATTTRKKVSGVVFHDREVDWQTMAEATKARAFGRWDEYDAGLVDRVAELRRQRPQLT